MVHVGGGNGGGLGVVREKGYEVWQGRRLSCVRWGGGRRHLNGRGEELGCVGGWGSSDALAGGGTQMI